MADWKEELKNAYDKSADEKVKQSDSVYQKKMAQVLGDALSRGLGRSSYAAATQANLLNDMNEAGNQIRTDFRLEYLKALQQRELEEEQLAENRRQFDLKLAASAGGGGGYGGYGGSSYSPGSSNPKPTFDPSKFNVGGLVATANTVNTGNTFGNALVSGYKTNKLKKNASGGAGKSVNMVR